MFSIIFRRKGVGEKRGGRESENVRKAGGSVEGMS